MKKLTAVAAAILATATILVGCVKDEGKHVTEVYTVKQHDTIWSISEEFLPKNTAERKYILQFQHEILEANPDVKANGCTIRPGDKLVINYRVR